MTDLATWPGVADEWPDYTPAPWSAEHVTDAVAAYIADANPPGLRTVFVAKPIEWDDPANFFGSGVPWGASGYVVATDEAQVELYTDNGLPARRIKHSIALQCLLKSTLNDTGAVTILQRRIEDGIKSALRASPTLGGRVYQAGIEKLTAGRDQPKPDGGNLNVLFHVAFEVTVFAPSPTDAG